MVDSSANFVDGSRDFATPVDNKHCIKNDQCQIIGGSFSATIGDYGIDCNILLQTKVSTDLIFIKDFSSDKKVVFYHTNQ